jgi:hypothetical protein
VEQNGTNPPTLSWTHNGTTITGYNLYLGANQEVTLASQQAASNFTDNGYNNDTRIYTVTAVDNTSTESIGRTLTLPQLTASMTATSSVKRGIMNKVEFDVTNNSNVAVSNAQLKIRVHTYDHISQSFNLAPGETQTIPVIIGGYNDLPDVSTMVKTIELTPNQGETVRIIRSEDITVGISALLLNITTDNMARGTNGQVQFNLENTSEVETEIITALNGGQADSNEVRIKLVDVDDNVLATQAVRIDTGTNVVRLANGTSVARIQPGETFTSPWLDLQIPASASDTVFIQFELDNYHYHVGQADHVAISGQSSRRTTNLIDTSYYGEVTAITPAVSYGASDITITGRAMDRASAQPLLNAPLKLVITNNNFERKFNVITNSLGEFLYIFKPLAGESGVYTVSVVHPDVQDKPNHGTFTINRLFIEPSNYTVNMPRNFDQDVSITVRAGQAGNMTNLRLAYDAVDQTGGVLPTGIQVTLPQPVNLASGGSTQLNFVLRGDNTAIDNNNILLSLYSDESGAVPLAQLPINLTLSEAVPVLFLTPNVIETGLAQGNSITERTVIENRGLAPMENVQIQLQDQSGGSNVPSWVYLTVQQNLGDVAVGQQHNIDINIVPPATTPDGRYDLQLSITSDNSPPISMPVVINLVQSGLGSVLFKAEDIYTATLDDQGQVIQGLSGARILLQNERVLTEEYEQTTDVNGEALFTDIPSGWYKFRATAANHQEVLGRVQIKAGTTQSQIAFLDYNLITVEWSVTEVTIQDLYEITLNATYETQVPAAVVVAEPQSTTLPSDMLPGDVFYGEFTLTNHGLIRADNVEFNMPPDDDYFKFEIMGGVPDSLDAQQVITVPYRVTALSAFNPDVAGDSSGAGCSYRMHCVSIPYDFRCANNITTGGATQHCWPVLYGSCGGGGTSGPGGGGYISPSPGTGGGGEIAPNPTPLGDGLDCPPTPTCNGTDCNKPNPKPDCGDTPGGEGDGGS